jgi:hypothetical protein
VKTNIHFRSYLAQFFLEWEIFRTNIVEKIETRLLKKNCTVYEIVCKNIVEPGWPQMTILCMRITCCLSKARNTRSQYVMVILFAFPQQHLLHERALMLRYTYIAVLTIIRTLMVVSICAIIRCGFHVCSYGAYSYNQCINDRMHLIKYDSWQVSNFHIFRHRSLIRRDSSSTKYKSNTLI